MDVTGLDPDEATEKVLHEAWTMGMRYDRLRRGIVGILQSHFHVTVVLAQPEIFVIGKPTDVLIAHYVNDFLLRAARNCVKAFDATEKLGRRRCSPSKRANYIQGFIWGLYAALSAGKKQIHFNGPAKRDGAGGGQGACRLHRQQLDDARNEEAEGQAAQ